VIVFSAKEAIGFMELKEKIKEMFYQNEIQFNDELYLTNARHKVALEKAKDSLLLVLNSIRNGMPEDFFSIDLMDAYEQLGYIIGESVEDDLVNEIFSKFCMGK
jgi:tRNA modification GTPase